MTSGFAQFDSRFCINLFFFEGFLRGLKGSSKTFQRSFKDSLMSLYFPLLKVTIFDDQSLSWNHII
ncbi:hypothetical protein CEV08_02905 [Bartonella tribocorum]|uniref:Uncharacterized protein n=1 Tax=Bartonella tribocorum TaxID=85701 RepID=A0A2M6UX96_9HYPH|nr:hypothetical protein CEV08_02905 [Bartonella tribocorum]